MVEILDVQNLKLHKKNCALKVFLKWCKRSWWRGYWLWYIYGRYIAPPPIFTAKPPSPSPLSSPLGGARREIAFHAIITLLGRGGVMEETSEEYFFSGNCKTELDLEERSKNYWADVVCHEKYHDLFSQPQHWFELVGDFATVVSNPFPQTAFYMFWYVKLN